MGFHERPGIWNKRTENEIGGAQERDMNISDIIERSRVQAENFAVENANHASVFISAGHRDEILESENQLSAARKIARENPHFVPDLIEGEDQQAAFLIALAEELDKPQYNQ